MNDTGKIFGEAETARLWAASLRDLAAERAEEGRTAEARELQRQAEVHELAARGWEDDERVLLARDDDRVSLTRDGAKMADRIAERGIER